MSQRILIAGAGGYIGTYMVESFLASGHEIVALDRFFFGDTLSDLRSHPHLTIVRGDIRTCEASIFQGVDTVIDLASISNDPASELLPTITESINHHGAVRLATLAKENGVKRYIFSSSCSVYGAGESVLTEESEVAPISTYARCKLAAEKEILALCDDTFCATILRNATVYGLSLRRMRFDLIINIMTLHAYKNRKIFVMGGGQQWRPLVHLADVVHAFAMVTEESDTKKINGQIFNVGSNEQNYQVFQVANAFREHFSHLAIELAPDDPDPRNYHVSFDKIAQTLGFHATHTIHDGIKEVSAALESGIIRDDVSTRTVEHYRYLINADKLLSQVKIGSLLFEL